MDVQEVMGQAREAMSVKRVFGEPIQSDGLAIVPVARIRGGAGGGEGPQEKGGAGSGFGIQATPAGVFVFKNGRVQWRPAVDVNRIVLGAQLLMGVAMVMVGRMFRRRLRR
jgi:uncharacterized spore protein YtfJ